jgi:putative ABC transport system permease protein
VTESKIIYTHTDEAPALATRSFLPILRAFADAAGDVALAAVVGDDIQTAVKAAQASLRANPAVQDGASLAVGGLVVALFFALVVLEKRELFAALKALGASSARLGGGVVLQALGATLTAVVVGALAARAVGWVLPDDIPFLFRPETLVVSATLTVVAGVVGAVLSLRRISRIDPATALGGSL